MLYNHTVQTDNEVFIRGVLILDDNEGWHINYHHLSLSTLVLEKQTGPETL